MDILQVSGFIGAFVIGIVLGLIGGGGSILTVPVLVYLLGINPVTATGYSLFVVGISSLVGAFVNMRKKLVQVKTAFVFAFPAFVVVYVMRRFIVPAIPEDLFSAGNINITKDHVIMVFFAVVMLVTSISMLRNKKKNVITNVSEYHYHILFLEGILVGVVAGFVGAGGGFLIIPALVLFARLPMKKAVATSLLIISINSLIGFAGDVEVLDIDWKLLLSFSGIAVLGIFAGSYLSNKADGKKLKRGFGWFVLLMGVYILVREFMNM
ncbi:sulfite exporter TauE/SafE family protein [Sinomicrobium weinanense]|uniref:Probable membrane transporter protein n=1 Tax=Sinomicrobium weinanense TaxID=2842200 RepID=A0A926JQH6_9FLAO|nr:sulfite exporter TauE/SafE family protein [Sinomicrobium weinanense]MBC9795438.1 sulfite exporter TauE/SafE family protein [Sinomicrobium weinanense]MBU3123963.1 sulfite exporter TauE/SafE family protein [Sinomicrobium weinanense]